MGKTIENGAFDLHGALRRNPVVPAVRGPDEDLEAAFAGDYPAVFVLGGDIFEVLRKAKKRRDRPPVFVNVDLVGGVAGDAVGIRFLSQHVEGIISTNRHVIELANSAGLTTVQRLFAIDAGAIEQGIRMIKRAKPRCIEILPALAYPSMVARYAEALNRPVLAGGLLTSKAEVSFILEAGATGVSTSHRGLWRTP
jgi:glycerol uptake operon antiterminator